MKTDPNLNLADELKARRFDPARPPELPDLLRKHETYFGLLIDGNGQQYGIEHKRIDTPEKLLGWIYHLAGKGRVTTAHVRALIEAAAERGVAVNYES
jgi:hypothetical protein